jgi:pimeloyl-ACP methyl ester carboxylesterase
VQTRATMAGFEDRFCWSRDNVRLTWRDYPGSTERPVAVCLHGLTRNARDFEGVAAQINGLGWRVVAVSLRGRGESGYARDAMTYVPLTYAQDLDHLLRAARVERMVLIGTSLGGILTMLLATTHRDQIAGALLNDVGPDLEPEGLAKIRSYVGKGGSWPSWLMAARALRERFGDVYPRWTEADWLTHAKRLCRVAPNGRIAFDYDPRIAEPFRAPGGEKPGVDLWPTLEAFRDVPVASVRGALSDLFSAATQARMAERLPHLDVVVVPDIGHAPTLDEPEAWGAIKRLLAQVGERILA